MSANTTTAAAPQGTVTHSTFVIERVYPHAPHKVYDAFANRESKMRWFGGPEEWSRDPHQLDFRVGGRERVAGGPKEGPKHTFDATYHDIVPERRIVYTYDLFLDDALMSVSIATIELMPEGSGTRLKFTEQGAFLDGMDIPGQREAGTRQLLETLGRALDA